MPAPVGLPATTTAGFTLIVGPGVRRGRGESTSRHKQIGTVLITILLGAKCFYFSDNFSRKSFIATLTSLLNNIIVIVILQVKNFVI